MSKHNNKRKHSKAKAKSIVVVNKALVQNLEAQITEHEGEKAQIEENREITPNGEVTTTLEDDKGNPVLSDTDKTTIDKAKKAQADYRQAKLAAQEALKTAKQAMEALNGSDAVKTMLSELTAKIAGQEDVVNETRKDLDAEIEKLQDLQAEYKGLTGIDKKSKNGNSKRKGNGNGNGHFETKLQSEKDDLRILITHKDSHDLFEYRLFCNNGVISNDNWLKLRHQFVAHYESKEDNLTLRAFLSGLKNQISNVKTIA